MVSGNLGTGCASGDLQHNGQTGTNHFSPLGSGPAWNPPLLLTTPLSIPSLQGLLTQGSIQILEDAAAVVQGDIDPFLQERGHQATAGTGPGRGQGSITPTVGSLPSHLCHFLSPHLLCRHIRPIGSPGKASQWPSPWDLLA